MHKGLAGARVHELHFTLCPACNIDKARCRWDAKVTQSSRQAFEELVGLPSLADPSPQTQ